MIGIATTGALLTGVAAAPAASADDKIASRDGQTEEMTRDFSNGFGLQPYWVKYAKSGNQCETTTYYNWPMPPDAMNYLPRVNPNRTIDTLPGGQNTNVCPPW